MKSLIHSITCFFVVCISLLLFSCEEKPVESKADSRAFGKLITSRWKLYTDDPRRNGFSLAEILYYAECEAARFGIFDAKTDIQTEFSPAEAAEWELGQIVKLPLKVKVKYTINGVIITLLIDGLHIKYSVEE